jgi:hypothetical protein
MDGVRLVKPELQANEGVAMIATRDVPKDLNIVDQFGGDVDPFVAGLSSKCDRVFPL